MNILIFNWRDPKNPKSGGAELVTMEHARRWAKKGNTTTWFTSSFVGGLQEEVIEGVKFIRRGNEYTVFIHAFMWYVASIQKFDIVIDEIHGLPFFTPLYVRVPKVAFIHELALEIWDHMYPFPVNIIGRFTEQMYFYLYKKIPFWTDAKSVLEELVHMGVPRGQCIAIPCPINNKPVESLPVKEKELTFLFAGRIVKMKGVEDIIQALKLIRIREPYSKLWILGAGERVYLDKIQHLVKSENLENAVKFFGKVSEGEKLTLMGRSHLLLHGSIREGWGLVVLEAASQGTPTVAYNVSGLRDTVKDGETGVLTKKNTPEDMSLEVLNLLDDKKRYSGFQEKGLAWVRSMTWEKEAQKSLRMLQEIYDQKN